MAATAPMSSSTKGIGWLGWAFPLFGVPFIVVGIGMMLLPLLAPIYARRTIYAVTDRRLIRLRKGRGLDVESLPAVRIGSTVRMENRDGRGTIKVANKIERDSEGDRTLASFAIENVSDAIAVERLIRELGRDAEVSARSSTD